MTLVYSFFSWNLLRPGSREFAFLDNYISVLSDSAMWQALLVTVLLTAGAVLASVLVGLAIALLVDRKFLGRGVVPDAADRALPRHAGGRGAAVEDDDAATRCSGS